MQKPFLSYSLLFVVVVGFVVVVVVVVNVNAVIVDPPMSLKNDVE